MQVLSAPQVPIGLPSPTLTNPDMILPQNSPSINSSPTNRRRHGQPISPSSLAHENTEIDASSGGKSHDHVTMNEPLHNGVLQHCDESVKLRRSSTELGRMISEKSRSSYQSSGAPLVISSAPDEQYNGCEQTRSTDNIEQDDELVESRGTMYSIPAILEEDENDPHSHAAMTRRAEAILANAKKRLTNMEGNLNRARSTLQSRPSSSMSSFSPHTAEPVSLYTLPINGRSPHGYTLSKHRQANIIRLDEGQSGHSRVLSETSVPSSLHTTLSRREHGQDTVEGSDGLDLSVPDTAARERHSEPSRNWFWNGLARTTSLNRAGRRIHGLQPLDEDGPAPDSFERPNGQQDVIEEEGTVDIDSSKGATFAKPPVTDLPRARSTAQMRDLREQMQDLKGKISTLKQRAREDNLRRRSLQSLRTPSPFTSAEQWYTGSPAESSQGRSGSGMTVDTQILNLSPEGPKETRQDSGHASPILETRNEMLNQEAEPEESLQGDFAQIEEAIAVPLQSEQKRVLTYSSQKDRLSQHREELGMIPNEEGNSDTIIEKVLPENVNGKTDGMYEVNSDPSLSDPPIIERHEDRSDAFDYEHIVLHSAMGTYSGVGVRRSSSMRKRSDSMSSTSSAETTRPRDLEGEIIEHAPDSSGGHARQNSVDSVSTDNTFATATEGEAISMCAEEEDETPRQSLVESPEQKRRTKQRPNGVRGSTRQANGRSKSHSKKHLVSPGTATSDAVDSRPRPVEKENPAQTPPILAYLSSLILDENESSMKTFNIGDRDRELVERLAQSMATVCHQLHRLGTEGGNYEARVCRRKLDSARRMLDGEVNGEAF